jgi:hypothetical protein
MQNDTITDNITNNVATRHTWKMWRMRVPPHNFTQWHVFAVALQQPPVEH